MPAGASAFYARNISALLLHMVKDGQLNLDLSDEITGAVVIATGGKVVQEATAKALGIEPATPAPAPAPEPAPEPEVDATAIETEAAEAIEDAQDSAEAIVEEAGVTATEDAEVDAVVAEAETPLDEPETPLTDTDGGKS
jgi:hypothetical protein